MLLCISAVEAGRAKWWYSRPGTNRAPMPAISWQKKTDSCRVCWCMWMQEHANICMVAEFYVMPVWYTVSLFLDNVSVALQCIVRSGVHGGRRASLCETDQYIMPIAGRRDDVPCRTTLVVHGRLIVASQWRCRQPFDRQCASLHLATVILITTTTVVKSANDVNTAAIAIRFCRW